MDTWVAIDEERKDTLALLESLEPVQWDVPSLCAEWKVRDVVAHLTMAATMSGASAVSLLLRNGLNFNRAMARSAREQGRADPAQLRDAFAATIGGRSKPPMTKPLDNLVDVVVHAQDIRRPLDIPRVIPEARLVPCLDRLKGYGFPFGAKKRVAGLRLEATDFDWASGEGPVVQGPGEVILLMLAGRRVVLGELSGDGAAVLATRG